MAEHTLRVRRRPRQYIPLVEASPSRAPRNLTPPQNSHEDSPIVFYHSAQEPSPERPSPPTWLFPEIGDNHGLPRQRVLPWEIITEEGRPSFEKVPAVSVKTLILEVTTLHDRIMKVEGAMIEHDLLPSSSTDVTHPTVLSERNQVMEWVTPSRARSAGLNTFVFSPPELDLSGLSRAMAGVNAAEAALKKVKEEIIKYVQDVKRILPASWSVVASSVTGLESFVPTARPPLTPVPKVAIQPAINPQPQPKRNKRSKTKKDPPPPPTEQEKKERRLARNARRNERKRQKRLEAGSPARTNVRRQVEQYSLPGMIGQNGPVKSEAELPEIKQEETSDGQLVKGTGVVDFADITPGGATFFTSSEAIGTVTYQQPFNGAATSTGFYSPRATFGITPQMVGQSSYNVYSNMPRNTFPSMLPSMQFQPSTALAHYASAGPNFVFAGNEWDQHGPIHTDYVMDDHDIHSVTDTDQNMSEVGDEAVNGHVETVKPAEDTLEQEIHDKDEVSHDQAQYENTVQGARSVRYMTLDSLDQHLREKIARLREIFPSATELDTKNAVIICRGNLDDAAARLVAMGARVGSADKTENDPVVDALKRDAPIEDIALESLDQQIRDDVMKLQKVFLSLTVLAARDALQGNIEDAAARLGYSGCQVVSDDETEIENSSDASFHEDLLEDGEILEENIPVPDNIQPPFRLIDAVLDLAATDDTRTRSKNPGTSASSQDGPSTLVSASTSHFERKPLALKQQQNGQQKPKAGYKDGDRVGATAPELDPNNKGQRMLVKMGWNAGSGLGASPNKGILSPIAPVIKTTKSGLR